MSKIQESLKANESEILAALPKEFHADFKKEMEAPTEEPTPLSGASEVEAIKAELVANPDVDDAAVLEDLKNIKAPTKSGVVVTPEAAAEAAQKLKGL